MSDENSTLEYLDPTSPKGITSLMTTPIHELKGKTIAFVNNGWSSFTKIGVRMEQVFRQKFGVGDFRIYPFSASSAAPTELFDRIASECDAAVVGMAN